MESQLKTDLNKQAQEIVFIHKLWNIIQPTLVFTGIPVRQTSCLSTHLGLKLDAKLDFQKQL